MMSRQRVLGLAVFLILGVVLCLTAGEPEPNKPMSPSERQTAAEKQFTERNFKDALDAFTELALDAHAATHMFSIDTTIARIWDCQNRLNRQNEFDDLMEKIIDTRPEDWRTLLAIAQYFINTNHYGYLISGKFERGNHRGGGVWATSEEHDRVRALQLMQKAYALQTADAAHTPNEKARLLSTYEQILCYNRTGGNAWRLQILTDIEKLPDVESSGSRYHSYGRSQTMGAPVTAEGEPLYYYIPGTFETAKNDGERWRWCMAERAKIDASNAASTQWAFAQFLENQFGVQTMAWYGRRGGSASNTTDESGPFSVHTLKENETIARLATGVKRFTLPDEFNYISIYQTLAKTNNGGLVDNAARQLAQIFENRRQYPKAAAIWQGLMKKYEKNQNHWNFTNPKMRYEQIVHPWGRFHPVMTQPAGEGACVGFRFRNGESIEFEAHALDINKLLADVKSYIQRGRISDESDSTLPVTQTRTMNRNTNIEYQSINLQNLGWRIVQNNQTRYVTEKVAEWTLPVTPLPYHFDMDISVSTPLQKAGAYLLKAKMKDGNESNIVIWISDTAIVKKAIDTTLTVKPLNTANMWYVADAVTGQAIEKANVEFFGWNREWVESEKKYHIEWKQFAEFTDANGMVTLNNTRQPSSHQWLAIARTDSGRLAFYGFSRVWYPTWYDREYNETKAFCITDRPVYRPGDTVKYKLWIRQAKYDMEDTSSYANQNFSIKINNPKGEDLFSNIQTADAYGGLMGEYVLPKDATLGGYSISTPYGGGSFRVEEYKKPEFEVIVEAPEKPVMLGEKITANVTAKYYFGSPVAQGKVKYKILRSAHDANWYPVHPWDWFYGPGYWWFVEDYVWYPGWSHWGGCKRPWFSWWHRPTPQPELVAEVEKDIPEDGKIAIEIDTALAKAMHGDTDHRYEITVEVTDQSRRTIVGTGSVLVARQPFKVYTWVDRGYYTVGDTVIANFNAQTIANKPIQGKGVLKLMRVKYGEKMKPEEVEVRTWKLDTNVEGEARQQLSASQPGQYRLSYTLTDSEGHSIEGGYLFIVRGKGFDGRQFRFDALELVTDKESYAPGETVKLMLNVDRADATVLLFIRPANGVCLLPKVIRMKGKSHIEEIPVSKKDMPNFFVEALTVHGAKVHTEMREIIVPPEKRVLNVSVTPSKAEYLPGEKATVDVTVTDLEGKPVATSVVLSAYDRAVEYISGGSNVADIKEFFWKWRRQHSITVETSLNKNESNITKPGEPGMNALGVFGNQVAPPLPEGSYGDPGEGPDGAVDRDEIYQCIMPSSAMSGGLSSKGDGLHGGRLYKGVGLSSEESLTDLKKRGAMKIGGDIELDLRIVNRDEIGIENKTEAGGAPVKVRSSFADTAFWKADITTDKDGKATATFDMPENLGAWKIRAWALTHGTKVGSAAAEAVTRKNLILRLQAPRFFVEKDMVVLSANIHNYLKTDKTVKAVLELDGDALTLCHTPDMDSGNSRRRSVTLTPEQTITIKAGGEQRVDWWVKAIKEGEAVVRMKAISDEESDAMEMRFPVHVHGADTMQIRSAQLRPEEEKAVLTFDVPNERRIDTGRMEIRYSPTLAMAMVDALPYMVEYPYGCTEQTLNRFLPTVITQKMLKDIGVNIAEVKDKITNLNAQEIGDAQKRGEQWKKSDWRIGAGKQWTARNPVFDEAEVMRMVKQGLDDLTRMQNSDCGWGWFSGFREYSYPHTTAVVVHGLQVAEANGIALVPGMLDKGLSWLERYRHEQVALLKMGDYYRAHPEETTRKPYKMQADNMDALVQMILLDSKRTNATMRDYLYRDRTHLSVYGLGLFGLSLHREGATEKRDAVITNIRQYLVEDNENQTAYLNLGNEGYWWWWYGSEMEAHAYFLRLLVAADPKDSVAPKMVKYLLNNRKHATYWNSTRDTSLIIEAFADYVRATGENAPDLTIEVWMDGMKQKEVTVNRENLFTFDGTFTLTGKELTGGKHTVELRKKGTGPLYINGYCSYFSLEDFITKQGLEVKVERAVYKLEREEASTDVAGAHGQALKQRVEKYKRTLLANDAELQSGDLIQVELSIESKNDYEYLLFEDMKAAGFEAVEVRSGYTDNEMGAYVEFRDNRVSFFIRRLMRGKHSVSYRLRAEIPGRFSALPAQASAMYAPELRANSDEIKLRIKDSE